METPIRITYRHTKYSASVDARVREHVAKLERECDRIVDCHVLIEPSVGGASSPGFEVNIDLTLPGRQIAVHSGNGSRLAHRDVYAVLRDAFETLRRVLQEHVPHAAAARSRATRNPVCG